MQERQISTKREQAHLSAQLRSESKTWAEIATVFRERYRMNGRVAMRIAHQLSQNDVAEKWNERWPDEPKSFKNISYWEQWPSSTGHQPSLLVLKRLAKIYECAVTDLVVDYADYSHLDNANRIQPLTIESHSSSTSLPRFPPQDELVVSDMWHTSETHTSSGQLEILPRPAGAQTIEGLRNVLSAQVNADAMIGSRFLIDAIRDQAPIIDNACRAARGKDQEPALRFAIEFIEFCGWLHQDSGDFACARSWTNKALDYAMELGDQRLVAYILMRKSNIATDAGDPATALGLTNAALANANLLTPRLRSVVLRQRAYSEAAMISAFKDTTRDSDFGRDSERAMAEALAGVNQQEEDFAPYCTPSYVEMEIGASLLLLGKPNDALSVFEASRTEWSDPKQARDNALCLARLATAHANVGDRDKASVVAKEAISAAEAVGSWRIIAQLATLNSHLAKWKHQSPIDEIVRRLSALISSYGHSG
jgi:tetratricopeptide (TPR) repeat protein